MHPLDLIAEMGITEYPGSCETHQSCVGIPNQSYIDAVVPFYNGHPVGCCTGQLDHHFKKYTISASQNSPDTLHAKTRWFWVTRVRASKDSVGNLNCFALSMNKESTTTEALPQSQGCYVVLWNVRFLTEAKGEEKYCHSLFQRLFVLVSPYCSCTFPIKENTHRKSLLANCELHTSFDSKIFALAALK